MAGSSRTVWIALCAVLFGHVALLTLGRDSSPPASLVRTLILDALTPVERLVYASVRGIGSMWASYIAVVETGRENERLRAENTELRMELERNRSDVAEAARLRRFFDLEPQLTGQRIAARVIAHDATVSRHTITIDKGTFHGLHDNAAVITPEGVVGRVIHAAHFSALVQLISDPDSAVGAIVESSRVQGIVRGWNNGSLRLEHLDSTADLLSGEGLITSGTDGIYPKGLNLGTVDEVGAVEDLMRTASVLPAAHLDRLEEVLCLINTTESKR